MTAPETPAGCVEHQPKYKPDAWHNYTFGELGWFVHNLAKRATHRADAEKRAKDLRDARNYLDMMSSKLKALEDDAPGTTD